MKGLFRLATASILAIPALAGAQDAECDVDLANPQFVGLAYVGITRAAAIVANDGDAWTELRQVLSVLTDPRARDRDRNPAARQLIQGQAYVLLLASDVAPTVRAGDIGIQANPDEMIDLVVAVDTLFRNVQATNPDCADLIGEFRRYKPWIQSLTTAIDAVNAGQLDSAEVLARRSLLLYTEAPYAHTILGSVAMQRGRPADALPHFRTALELAHTDTVFSEVVVSIRGDVARALSDLAAAAPASEQAARTREAIAAYEEYLAETSIDDVARSVALDQVAALYPVVGDTAAVRRLYAGILENPAAHGENTLLRAGGLAMAAQAYADAARLFNAAYAINPYNSDVLNNLAASLIGADRYPEAIPVLRRLITQEPNSAGATELYGYAYTGLVQATPQGAQRRAYTDSLVKYTTLADQMPLTVTFTEFTRMASETRIAGRVSNRGRASGAVTLTLELLGSDGQVVGTEEVGLAPIAAGASESFTATFAVPGAQVRGYRYRRLN